MLPSEGQLPLRRGGLNALSGGGQRLPLNLLSVLPRRCVLNDAAERLPAALATRWRRWTTSELAFLALVERRRHSASGWRRRRLFVRVSGVFCVTQASFCADWQAQKLCGRANVP